MGGKSDGLKTGPGKFSALDVRQVLDRAGIGTLAAAPAQANTARGCRRGSSGEGAATAMACALDGDGAARGHRIQVVEVFVDDHCFVPTHKTPSTRTNRGAPWCATQPLPIALEAPRTSSVRITCWLRKARRRNYNPHTVRNSYLSFLDPVRSRANNMPRPWTRSPRTSGSGGTEKLLHRWSLLGRYQAVGAAESRPHLSRRTNGGERRRPFLQTLPADILVLA